jgi:hypothetical protein
MGLLPDAPPATGIPRTAFAAHSGRSSARRSGQGSQPFAMACAGPQNRPPSPLILRARHMKGRCGLRSYLAPHGRGLGCALARPVQQVEPWL